MASVPGTGDLNMATSSGSASCPVGSWILRNPITHARGLEAGGDRSPRLCAHRDDAPWPTSGKNGMWGHVL